MTDKLETVLLKKDLLDSLARIQNRAEEFNRQVDHLKNEITLIEEIILNIE